MLTSASISQCKNTDRANAFAKAVRVRDDFLVFDLLESLRQMPGLVAHDILDRASDLLSLKDRAHMEAAINIFQDNHAVSQG